MTEPNGQLQLVRIGPAQDDVLPLSRAERVLQLLNERDPEYLGWLIGQTATSVPARSRRPPRAPR